jgi:F-type H+-transporting ATPase subunit a
MLNFTVLTTLVKNPFYSTTVSSPLEQFEIRNLLSFDAPILGDINLSLTNIGLYLIIGALIILSLNILATNYNKIGSNN